MNASFHSLHNFFNFTDSFACSFKVLTVKTRVDSENDLFSPLFKSSRPKRFIKHVGIELHSI